MKNVFIVFFLCFFVIHSNAQMSVNMGDLKYKITNYRGAAKSYKRYLNDVENQYDIAVIRKLAYAYQKSNQSALAEQTFAKLTIMDSSFADVVAYSEMLLKNKKYDSLNKFLRSKPELLAKNDARISNILTTVKNVNQLVNLDTGNIRISKLNFNNSNTDFAPSFFQNGLIFSSNRISNGFLKSKKTKSNKQIAGLYFSNTDDGFKVVKSFASNLKMKGNYSNASYHAKSRTLYYTVNANPKKANSIDKDINIYLAKFDVLNNTWIKGSNFPFNSPKYSNTTPFVNQEGTVLFFSSNMTGGYGGFDLYVSYWKDSTWTVPQNMGASINSAGDELYPFVDNTNLLYYSSNGKGGLGGMDIFTFDLNNPNAMSENLGAPFNSNTDDVGFIKYAKSEKGYFSSARASNGNEYDLYTFTRLKPTTKDFRVNFVDAISNQEINGLNLTVKTEEDTKLIENVHGFQRFENVEPGKKYVFTAAASNYEPASLDVLVNRIDTLFEMRLNRLKDGCSVQGKVVDKSSSQALANVKIIIRNELDTNEVYTVYTNNNGVYSIKGLKKSSNYTFNVELENYFPSLKNLKTLNTCIPVNNSFDYTQDFKLISGSIVQIDSIYFDFNKWDIRKDAAKELDKIVKFMKENPEVVVELYSHTDSRGTDKVNMAISQRRANNSVRYITSKGISKKRITGKGFGANKLLNNCTVDANCTEAQHQVNRRTEMKVVNIIETR
jgi:outer membrane protein OmpA-like peptidoglycan-associated protein